MQPLGTITSLFSIRECADGYRNEGNHLLNMNRKEKREVQVQLHQITGKVGAKSKQDSSHSLPPEVGTVYQQSASPKANPLASPCPLPNQGNNYVRKIQWSLDISCT
jgi:hypothetical protein